ncbi:MAG TPA: transketolase C-terminal domain-containing protein, partial [Puia sp.]|nr:transketolase C-terminal domain-containing protein [Puia sp.]
FGRPSWPIFTDKMPFEIGKAQILSEGTDVSVFACGHLVWKAVEAAKILQQKGVSVELINLHTIKPLDTEAILRSVRKTRCVVTAEEHNVIGGMGDAVAQTLARHFPAPVEYVGTNDTFGESGTPAQLLVKYGLDTPDIISAAERVISRKNK